ncbi:hypothetical protein D8S78_23955 [Natrialba swarupiae]|nr:hypothetical protein [Natrialba swarupiae]
MDRSIWVFLNVPVERAGAVRSTISRATVHRSLLGMSVVNVGQGTEAIVAESVMGETGIVVPSAE